MSPLTKPRRILAAVLLTLLLAAGTYSLVGMAAAEADEARFSVVEPMIGDRITYEAEFDGGDMAFREEVTYEFLPVEGWRDGNGTWRDVIPLQATYRHEGEDSIQSSFNLTYLVDPVSRQGIGTRSDYSFQYTSDHAFLIFPTQIQIAMEGVGDRFRKAELPCGFLTALQGEGIAMGAEVDLAACGVFTGSVVEVVDGIEAVRFEGENVTAWFAPHVPYPLRIVWSWDGASWTWAATGFHRGTTPLPREADAQAAPLPDADLAPRSPFGPAHETLVPFTVEDAWDAAMAHPDADGLHAFLEDHPAAIIVEASSTPLEGDTWTSFTWQLVAAEGTDAYRFTVTRTWERPLRSLPSPIGQDTAVGPPEDDYDDMFATMMSGFLPYPSEDQLPDRLPTVASVAAIWQAYSGGGAVNTYGFSFWCDLPDCDEIDGMVYVAQQSVEQDHPVLAYVPGQGYQRTGDLAYFSLDLEGRPYAVGRDTDAVGQSTSSPLDPVPPGEGVERGPDVIPIAAGVAWVAPSPAAAAGIGFIAVLAGVLYWLWPAIKSLPVLGLFSRLQRHKLLDHPVRAALMERIEADPGIHYQALVRAEGRGRGVIEHHLRHLESAGLVVVDRTRGLTCYFPRGTDRRAVAATVVLKSDGTQAVLAAIKQAPGCTAKEAGRRASLSPATVSHHLHKLQEAGLVRAQRGPRGALALYAA